MMHSDYEKADRWSHEVIGAAIEVHRLKGAGLLESIYEKCLVHELVLRGVPAESQMTVPITYKDMTFEHPIQLDVYVDGCLVVELKAVERVLQIHKAQLMSYMKLLNAPIGLLINFHEVTLKQGIHRMVLPDASGG
jgi:GxxExxY protein